ncbi:MAG: hypothetical protein Q4A17_01995 [Thermoguttaceae bacterium]|nr:hypothetical protein [Thermoguttaceae bacterium]MDO4856701.1 hypothetical protein [Thermoguttaceae bacterium]
MCLFNKILIGLIIIAIGACFYFSAISLKTHSFWGEDYNKSAKALPLLEDEITLYKYGKGVPDTEDYKRSTYELDKYLRALRDLRGPVYRDCSVDSNFTSDGGTFAVSIPGVTTQVQLSVQLPINTPIYAFTPSTSDASKMQYLGRFLVKGYAQDEGSPEFYVVMEPTRMAYEKNERMQSVLSKARGLWTIFFEMPIDKAEHGSDNEDYIPFETKIQYYVEQEYIMQDLIDKQEKHIKGMEALIGSKESEKGEPALYRIARVFKGETELRKKDDGSYVKNLASLYKDFEEQNKAMKDANAALASEVQRLESTKQGYERSIDQRMKPIMMKQ